MAVFTVAQPQRRVILGVDTHTDVNVAAALDEQGQLLAVAPFDTTFAGHRAMERWATHLGVLACAGVEGTGAYGAGLARYLTRRGVRVVEVDRPDRKTRRFRGKSDPIDAEAAARAVLAGRAIGTPKSRTANVESIRALRVARRSAMKARIQAAQQLRCLVTTAPDELRHDLRKLSLARLVKRCAAARSAGTGDVIAATRLALRSVARRYLELSREIAELDEHLGRLVTATAPQLLVLTGVGIDVAGQLLVTAGDNPQRLRSEASFAQLCGVAPIPASSGKTNRHRLNRGGDRHANAALYRMVVTRLHRDERSVTYMARRLAEGHSKAEVIRCLKRYAARDVYRSLQTCRA